jgi:hypothetical protein
MYCTVRDIREEGFQTCDFTDARVTKAIKTAQQFIDKVTRRFFEPRDLTIRETWQGEKSMLLRMPIVAVSEMRFVNLDETLQTPLNLSTDVRIFNRHVREGLTDPDDREDPQIALIFVSPNLIVPRIRPVTVQEVTAARVQQIQIAGTFGYTEPTFNRARSIASGGGDAITAPNTIVMDNASFEDDDVGHTITIAGSSTTNDGDKTIVTVVNAKTVTVKETLVTEAVGFTASIVDFPQVGIVPPQIAEVCKLLAIRNLPKRATESSLDRALSGGRLRRMQTRDQSIDLDRDPRLTGIGGGALTGDAEIDLALIAFRAPPALGRA